MNILNRFLHGKLGAAARAGVTFLTVSVIGAVALVILALVLWAASLTPFGMWAGLPVIALGAGAAAAVWRRGQAAARSPGEQAALLQSSVSFSEPIGLLTDAVPAAPAPTAPRVRVIEAPARTVPRLRSPLLPEPGGGETEALKRAFDQAFAAGRLEEAEGMLDRLTDDPGQLDWTRRKRRLLDQQRARR